MGKTKGRLILVSKCDDTSDPSCFRPIALTSTIGKLFHKILARRFEKFCLANGLIDPAIQKGFLHQVSGAVEHISSVNCIINQAQELNLPLHITFLDLQNAFGSVPHQLISDILHMVRIPASVIQYVVDSYSKLQAYVHTRCWDTPHFPIRQGVFQGDTMSPIIFLLAMSPLLHLASSWSFQGFKSLLTIPESDQLPPVSSSIYILWDEPQSPEPSGWYKATVSDHFLNGNSAITYYDGQTESLNLRQAKWIYARKNGKAFITSEDKLPNPPKSSPAAQPKFATGQEHKAKAFADDLTIINSNKTDHQSSLLQMDLACRDLGMKLKPQKCVSLSIEKGKFEPNSSFPLLDGSTRSISDAPTKFLGQTIAKTPSATRKSASAKFSAFFNDSLHKIDIRPVRGEIKLWILRHYLIPSSHFHLMVNQILPSTISTLEDTITKYIKKWLKLPRNATQAIIFHPSVTKIPTLSSAQIKAKLCLLASLSLSTDPAILEINSIINDQQFLTRNFIPSEAHELFRSLDPLQPKKVLKNSIRKAIIEKEKQKWNEKLSTLQVQGKFSDIVSLEEDTGIWNRIIDGLPKGQLAFLLKAGSDTLPTPMNLHRWHLRVSSSCPLCSQHSCTTAHILSGCPKALEDGRYTWRHDSVLLCIYQNLRNLLSPGPPLSLYVDLPGLRASEVPQATIPPQVIVTSSRPDLVVIQDGKIRMLELTVCGNTSEALKAANTRKSRKLDYLHLVSDLQNKGWEVDYQTIEIGALGHHLPSAPASLSTKWPKLCPLTWKKILVDASTIAINCSQSIFLSRSTSPWPTNKALLT